MSENRKCFTFIWKIRNFNFCFNELQIASPEFSAHVLSEIKWRLYLNPNASRSKDSVACRMHGLFNYYHQYKLEFDYELSFLANDGSVLHSEIFRKRLYDGGYFELNAELQVKKDEVFLLKNDLFMPDDTITIRCRMWNSNSEIPHSGRCFAETLIETECRSFIGTMDKFNFLRPVGKYPLLTSSSTNHFLSSANIFVLSNRKLLIEIELVNRKHMSTYKYEIFIKDTFGNKVKYGQAEFHDSKPHYFPLTISMNQLIENKRFYIPNGVLTIECKVTFHTDTTKEIIYEPEYGCDCEGTKVTSNSTETNFSSQEQQLESFTTLKDDLNSLLMEGVLCDTKLKTATETFPAHTAVLGARSSVFKSMFTADMKEKTSKCVDIHDLEADTVRRMLSFMYTDTLDDLEYESAKDLYFAADKYNILALSYRCSNILKQNIHLKNCCEVLSLADQHQDKELKIVVQDFIAENDEAVLFSDEWKNLEKNHPHLTIEVLRAVYMKNRRK